MSDSLLVLIGLERNSTIDQILNLQNGVEMQNKCFHSIFFFWKISLRMSSGFEELCDRAGVNNDVLNKVNLTLRSLPFSRLLNVTCLQQVR